MGMKYIHTQGNTVSCSQALSATLGTAPTPSSASLDSTLCTVHIALCTSDTSGVVCSGCDPASLTC